LDVFWTIGHLIYKNKIDLLLMSISLQEEEFFMNWFFAAIAPSRKFVGE
jgi:hypothetical protein